ncbi:acyl-CoA thioesterase [Pseudonocardia kunmingensis]|uniref:Acyl-CoA thioesterase-2 n=1 Tax=Pseudonocardia kunmingensis TaxID=630975 RepID=A0A543DPX9_9PSEU|nr:acyl-CoA thioesterase domain-containing protein [Pseudonocardia kunmingensis]TQM11365.1 acyl-CoA thioesterase-2 [Pseudonocardia kunmingensis]
MTSVRAVRVDAGPSLLDLLTLEPLERDLYRATTVFDDPFPLYGGQVAAQALQAAGDTVSEDRAPHSLHCYYLRGGDASQPTIFRVERDRDGRSYSARRVVAVQGGEAIFTMSASFHVSEPGADRQVDPAPEATDPGELPPFVLPRLFSMEGRLPPQAAPAPWPTRFWARHRGELAQTPLLHAGVLTYLSDISSGLSPLRAEAWGSRSGASLDHAVWFHRRIRMDDWVLLDLVPHTVAAGRGWYTGTVHSRDGVLGASLTQECLFRQERQA